MLEMKRVSSSWVAAIGYDEDREEVFIELIEGGSYAYTGVPWETWRAFLAAESKGTFVNQELKPAYRVRAA